MSELDALRLEVDARLARLERHARWYRLLAGLFLAGIVVLACGQSPTPPAATRSAAQPATIPDEIKAQSFVVVDKNGEERGSFGLNLLFGDTGPSLLMRSHTADEQIVLSLNSLGPIIGLKSRGNRRASMKVEDGSPSISLYDEDGHVRAVVGVAELISERSEEITRTPESSIALFNKKGGVVWRAPSAR